jgi:MscS family membrane protein
MMLRRIYFFAIWLGFASVLLAREADNNTTAAAAAATVTKTHEEVVAQPPTIMEQLVDNVLARLGVHDTGNTTKRVLIVIFIVLLTLLLRRVVVALVFRVLSKLAARTTSTLDDRLISALHRPAGALITVTGIFAALAVLRFPPSVDRALGYGSTMAFSLVIFWGLYRMFSSLLDHTHEVALERQLGVAAFMPWIKRTLVALFIGVGVLLIIQSLGYNVSTILQGLGIGGLAFALAAQDTIANLFGSIVVAVDQPFLIGETVTIASHTGTVEDIGLRSTKLRRVDRSLVVIPNRSVANEAIVNLSRFTARRVEQVFTLTYDARPEDMEGIVNDIRGIIRAEPDVDQTATMVYFRDLNSSSLDVWSVYVVNHPDFDRHMAVRQRVNVAVMRAVAARGLSFAFPTQTMHLPDPVVEKLTDRKNP